MKKRTKLIITYVMWAALLQHHAGAGQKIFAILDGKTNRVLSLAGYLAISLTVISVGAFVCKPFRMSVFSLVPMAFATWFLAFFGYWLLAVHSWGQGSYESLQTLFAYLVLPHILLPIAPLLTFAFTMKTEENARTRTPNQAL